MSPERYSRGFAGNYRTEGSERAAWNCRLSWFCGAVGMETIAFIICYDKERYLEECTYYIRKLQVPKGFQIDIVSVRDVSGNEELLREAVRKNRAEYKVCMDQRIYIVNDHFLYEMAAAFRCGQNVGAVGILGGCFPEEVDYGRLLLWDGDENGIQELNVQFPVIGAEAAVPEEKGRKNRAEGAGAGIYTPEYLSNMFLVTRCDTADCMEIRELGYKLAIPYQKRSWCLYDCRENGAEGPEAEYRFWLLRVEMCHDQECAGQVERLLAEGRLTYKEHRRNVEKQAFSKVITGYFWEDFLLGKKPGRYLKPDGAIYVCDNVPSEGEAQGSGNVVPGGAAQGSRNAPPGAATQGIGNVLPDRVAQGIGNVPPGGATQRIGNASPGGEAQRIGNVPPARSAQGEGNVLTGGGGYRKGSGEKRNGAVRDKMHVVMAFNHLYVVYAAVMLQSLYENNPLCGICVHVLQCELSGMDRNLLQGQAREFGNEVLFYDCRKEWLPEGCPVTQEWSLEAYFRLFMTDVLPENVDRILYLDVDIIVNRPLYEFYFMDMQGYDLVACRDFSLVLKEGFEDKRKDLFARQEEEGNFIYFNSGVMLADMGRLREKICGTDYLKMAMELEGRLLAPDQDILNIAHWKNVGLVDEFRYDLFQGCLKDLTPEEVKQQVSIIHYAGPKPWRVADVNLHAHRIWWEYAGRVGFLQ